MKLAILFLAALCSVALAGDSKVLDLTSDNFQSTIESNDLTLVEFFAPWCGHCKALAPEFDKASLELVGKNAGVLAKVDCTEQKSLCNDHGVRGFPTLKLFRKAGGAPQEYDSARKADAIVRWMVKQNQPAVVRVNSAEEAEAFVSAADAVKIVAFVSTEEELASYTAVASALRNEYNFAVAQSNGALNAAYGVTSTPTVIMFRIFDEPKVSTNTVESAALTSWIKGQAFPILGEIGPENYAKYVERGLNFVWIFLNLEDPTQTALIDSALLPVAKDNRNNLSFVKLDGVRWAEHAKSFGLNGQTPGIAIEDRTKGRNYLYVEDTVTEEGFRGFVQRFLDGKLVANLKSEPIPTSNNGPVTVVVGKTFDSIVMNDNKDVLVEFYAPWCGHCKSLVPIYDELGRQFADNDKVVIAKIDATANDTPAKIQGFPTIMLYPAGDKSNPIEYEGDRTAKALADFVKARGTTGAAAADAAENDKDEL